MAGENLLQRYFKARCKEQSILWRKLSFEGRRGCPDTLIAKDGKIMLVEIKNPNRRGKLSELQKRQIGHLQNAGIDVRVVASKEEVDDVIREFL